MYKRLGRSPDTQEVLDTIIINTNQLACGLIPDGSNSKCMPPLHNMRVNCVRFLGPQCPSFATLPSLSFQLLPHSHWSLFLLMTSNSYPAGRPALHCIVTSDMCIWSCVIPVWFPPETPLGTACLCPVPGRLTTRSVSYKSSVPYSCTTKSKQFPKGIEGTLPPYPITFTPMSKDTCTYTHTHYHANRNRRIISKSYYLVGMALSLSSRQQCTKYSFLSPPLASSPCSVTPMSSTKEPH